MLNFLLLASRFIVNGFVTMPVALPGNDLSFDLCPLRHEEQLRDTFAGAVECDETAFGGHRKGKHWGHICA